MCILSGKVAGLEIKGCYLRFSSASLYRECSFFCSFYIAQHNSMNNLFLSGVTLTICCLIHICSVGQTTWSIRARQNSFIHSYWTFI